jgi:hypothetical protein
MAHIDPLLVASFGLAPVTQVGLDLGRKLAALLGSFDIRQANSMARPDDHMTRNTAKRTSASPVTGNAAIGPQHRPGSPHRKTPEKASNGSIMRR